MVTFSLIVLILYYLLHILLQFVARLVAKIQFYFKRVFSLASFSTLISGRLFLHKIVYQAKAASFAET